MSMLIRFLGYLEKKRDTAKFLNCQQETPLSSTNYRQHLSQHITIGEVLFSSRAKNTTSRFYPSHHHMEVDKLSAY
jgi:hypothetical protein